MGWSRLPIGKWCCINTFWFLIILQMKYLSLLSLTCLIAISGCSLIGSPSWPIIHEWEQYYPITWRLIYHNPELDRWEGKESWSTHRIISLEVKRKDFRYFSDFFETSGAYYLPIEGDTGTILLGCSTGSYEYLSSDLTLVDTLTPEGRYTRKRTHTTIPLPANWSWSTIHALITKPVFSYPLANDLPDVGRIDSCEGLVEIKDIQIIN